jgi:hypothetical protein
MRSRIIIVFCLLFCASAIVSCRRNQYRVNTAGISADIKIRRLEAELFTPDPSVLPSMVPVLKEKYGGFLQLFSFVINAGDINDPGFSDLLVSFVTDRLNYEVYGAVMQQFPDVSEIEENMENAFRHYLWYFPEKIIPEVITCITGFNSSIIAGDSVLGISLDRYLGSDCEYYPRLEIYRYIAARMNSYNIVPDCIYGWGTSEWIFDSMSYQTDNVLARILHEGKLRYFEKCMLPEVNDTVLFGFTADQMKFCRNNELQMWQYLIEHDLLFSTDQFTIRKLTGEAPFTSFFTKESPGRAAVWLGFRIIESYMMKNRDISLGDLMINPDIQGILEKARYNPK